MPRPPGHKLSLTFEEMTWVVKTVQRKAMLAEKVEKDKRLKEVVIKFGAKVAVPPTPEPDGSYVLPTNRHELRFLQLVVKNTHAVIVTTTIPEYAKRAATDPVMYDSYHVGAIKLSEMLVALRNKIEEVL